MALFIEVFFPSSTLCSFLLLKFVFICLIKQVMICYFLSFALWLRFVTRVLVFTPSTRWLRSVSPTELLCFETSDRGRMWSELEVLKRFLRRVFNIQQTCFPMNLDRSSEKSFKWSDMKFNCRVTRFGLCSPSSSAPAFCTHHQRLLPALSLRFLWTGCEFLLMMMQHRLLALCPHSADS